MTAQPYLSNRRLQRIRAEYFGSAGSGLLTLISLGLIIGIGWAVLNWALLRGSFTATATQAECMAKGGACWSVIAVRWRVILFGIYPYEEQWRSAIACAVVVVMTILSCLPVMWRFWRLAAVWGLGTAAFYILMRGGYFGLIPVDEQQWGGLALTLFLFVTTSVLGMPMAIGLALMRRSDLPVIARVTGIIIDTIRSLPLLSILFAFAIVLPFVLPDALTGDKLYRVIWGGALFFAAYEAEILRGGFQGISKGQEEAAKALGLPYWHRISRIVLPQAFRLALPATINQIVITFMETSLVVVVGFVELLAAGNTAYQTGEWKFAYVEVYAFISLIYFSFVFGLSRYGAYLESRMNAGQRKE
ncbi:amino acid ABC transporter permease [Fuscibacter oryzae]|uniref:Amino acid ABC transporter permease n=1 Tax=Fuscibacter oryzae TaxID=2803939 RepID=A0A8J7MTN3_9RHOB|nr:amino acid ABC transporter permease [Fuscibacter oryzae]MBL4930168.1 amino acid ABC transporter permease [Fuscibacter oryzae]